MGKLFLDLLNFVEFTNLFRSIERAIWFKGVRGSERNGEHAFQLAMCAWFLNERASLGLDVTRLIPYALVHDLVETYAGDTPAFRNIMVMKSMTDTASTLTRNNKEKRESEAFERIRQEWSDKFPSMIEHMEQYARQADRESRFIYALDKLIPGLNVFEDGGSTYRKLGITLEEIDTYQRPKVGRDATVLALYEEFYAILKGRECDFFYRFIPGSKRIGGPST